MRASAQSVMPPIRRLAGSMNITLTGALIGTAVAASLFTADYLMLRAGATERAKKMHRKFQLDGTERERIASIARFCICVPPAFALIFWIVWG